MADSVIKTVVVELETKYNQEGQKQAAAGLNELGKQAKTLKDTVLDNITRIDKAYAELGKKKITPNDKSFIDGYLKGIQKQLNELIKDWDKLSQTQRESASQLIAKTDQIIKEFKLLDETQKDLGKSSKQVQESTSNFLDSVSLLTPALGKYGFAVDKAVTSLNEYLKAAKNGNVANTDIGKGLEFLKSKWAAVGIAAAGAAAGAAAFFTKTTEGSEGLSVFSRSIGLQFDNIFTNLGKKFEKLIKGDISGAFTGGLLTLSDKDAQAIARSGIELEKQVSTLNKLNAEKQIAIALDREIISQPATRLDEVNRQLEALQRVRKTDNEVDENNIKIAKLRLDQLNKELSVKAEILPIDIERRNQAEIEVSKATEAAAAGDRLFNRLEKGLLSNRDSIIKNFNDLLADLEKSVDEFNFQDTFGKIFSPNLSEFDKAKLERDLQNLNGDLLNKIAQLQEASGGGLEIPAELQLDTDNAITRILDVITKLRQGIEFALLPVNGGGGNPKLNLDINTGKVKKAAEIKAEREGDAKERERKAFQDAQREAENALNAFFELELKKTDFLINEQQRRVDKLQEIAALGNAEQLQLEEERLNKLIQKREEAAKRQAQIDSLVKLSNTGVAISNYVAAITSSAATRTPIAAILEGVALLAAVFAGITQLKGAFQGFEEGTMNVSSDPRTFKGRGKSDTVPAWLAPGEIVLPVDVANEIRKEVSSVHEIPKMIKRSSGTYGYIVSENKANATYNFRNVEALLQENNRLLKESNDLIQSTQVDINFDHIGYNIQQRRKAKQDRKHKTQRR